jgi:hypothetical protein
MLNDTGLVLLNLNVPVRDLKLGSLCEILGEIEHRPELFIGKRSISLLAAFLQGIAFLSADKLPDWHLMQEFQTWVEKKYKLNTTHHWSSLILFFSLDERDALDQFFRMFKVFLEERSILLPEV